ncbi:LysE family translocator [Sphingomonas sp. Mn802worker]|uniref:LysE family translocator n=1 Tax=Sphingomonas sp. Mn802worker TaxID=629773 RepID=UPI00037A5EE8|nr:LysE family translocator [Sphingomonas sp. Mn802worker]
MTLHTWWLFVVAVFLLCGTPGPNMLHILSRSVEVGVRRTTFAMAGCLSAMLIVLAAAAAGLTTLLRAMPGAFDVLRYVGVAYLIYLGIKAWRSKEVPLGVGAGTLPRAVPKRALFRGGFAIGISNPKLILFAAAFLPQFVSRSAPEGPQFAILVVTFVAMECVWYAVYALGGRSLSRYIARPRVRRVFDRVTGAIFVGFGVALFTARLA